MKNDPAASVRWFGAEQAVTWALQAFYAACRDIEPPAGESWGGPESGPWADKGGFLHAFHSALTWRLNLAAWRHGDVPPPESATELLGWPDRGDLAAQVAFLEGLRKCGLCVDGNAADNRSEPGVG
jgi:hypothetical protein